MGERRTPQASTSRTVPPFKFEESYRWGLQSGYVIRNSSENLEFFFLRYFQTVRAGIK